MAFQEGERAADIRPVVLLNTRTLPKGLEQLSRASEAGKARMREMRIEFGLRYALGGALLAALTIGPLIYFLHLRWSG